MESPSFPLPIDDYKSSKINNKDDVIMWLYKKNFIRFGGPFTLKSGISSSFYIDLRGFISYPLIFKKITYLMKKEFSIPEDHICGVPSGAYHLASIMSIYTSISCLFLRKEVKDHGSKKLIEGFYDKNDTVCVLDDVLTTGSSVIETIEVLTKNNLIVTNVFVIVDREYDGIFNITSKYNVKLTSYITLTDIIRILQKNITPTILKSLKIEKNPVNEMGKKLKDLMFKKQTNLCFSADFIRTSDILALTKKIASHICMLKIHTDMIEDLDENFMMDLKSLSLKEGFLVCDDRKFADISYITQKQLSRDKYKYIDIVTVHGIAGLEILNAFDPSKIAVLLIHTMSSNDNLISDVYSETIKNAAVKNVNKVMGLITHNGPSNMCLFNVMPGISFDSMDNSDTQQSRINPVIAINNYNADIIIVGRGIYNSEDPEKTAQQYKEKTWKSYSL